MGEVPETSAYAREPAWHRLGNVFQKDAATADEMGDWAGLKWLVTKIPLLGLYAPEGDEGEELEITVPSHMAVIRTDRIEQGPLGVVGHGHQLLQNHELLEFAEMLQDTDEATLVTAGSLRKGKVVWVTAKIAMHVRIAGMEDEAIDSYLMLTNAHDGSRSLTGVTTPVRTVCENTLNLAISKAVRAWSVRHTPGMMWKLQDAREALGISFKYYAEFEKAGNALVKQKLLKRDFARFLEQLVPYDEAMAASVAIGEPSRAAKNVDEARAAVEHIYRNADNLANVRNTKWAALNAVAEYVDYFRPQRSIFKPDKVSLDERAMDERRFVQIVIDNTMKQDALKLLDPSLARGAGGVNLDKLAHAALA
jgi:phage/plasmid-like protein (TIGR03299 family)